MSDGIPEWLVWPIRAFLVFMIGVTAALWFVAAPVKVNFLSEPCLDVRPCPQQRLAPAEFAALGEIGLTPQAYSIYMTGVEAVVVVVSLALASLIVWHASHRWMGVLTACMLIITGGGGIGFPQLYGVRPDVRFLLSLVYAIGTVGQVLFSHVFPNGKFYPKWSRLVLFLIPPMLIVGFNVELDRIWTLQWTPALVVQTVLIVTGMLSGLAAQVIRYRRMYTDTEREQIRLIVAAFGAMFLGALFYLGVNVSGIVPEGRPALLAELITTPLLFITIALIPAAFGYAILRHRLLNIDLIVRRTLQYGVISTVLGAAYFTSIVLVQGVFRRVTGAESPLGVVLSTLLIAALFNPVRSSAQQIIDRAFFRQKVDAEQLLDTFREAVHDEVDPDAIAGELTRAAALAVQPESVSLWLVHPKE